MADIKSKYAAAASLTITANALANSNTAGRESTAIDNTSLLYLDALLEIALGVGAGTIGSDKTVTIYAYSGGIDGGNYAGGASGSDAAYTIADPTELKVLAVIPFVAQSTTKRTVALSVASAFGGVLPPKWGIVVKNFCGITLNAFTAKYVGVHGQTV